ncbi:putative reverse transcriptase domain-containing protein, partial [Tanacetum coccineum]
IVMENPNHLNEPNETIPEVNPVLEDDAELIFPYEVEGDKTSPPGDVSSDFVSSDSESEDEEVDVVPEATAGTITQKPYVIRDFPRGLFEALRRNLEASRAQARVMEAELGTCQTEIALLKSKNKIGEKERELLNHDLENVERALGNVLERMSVLESGENATLEKRLAETETKLVWARMECETAERRLHESRVWNKIFYLDMVRFGAVPKLPSDDEDWQRPKLLVWFEKLESVFQISDCKERDKVKFATATLQGRALTWWNGRIASMGIDAANGTPWTKVKVEQYIHGLSKNKRGDGTSSRLAGIDEAVCMAYQLMGQIIQDKTDEASKGEKRKGEGDRGGHGDNRRNYNRRQNQRRANAGAMTNAAPNDNEVCPKCKNKKHGGDCWKCGKCGKLGHKTAACWSLDRKDVTCFNCNEKGHRKRDCPKLKKNGQGGNNRGAVYKLGAVDAQQDPKVVTGTFLLNNRYATALFDSGADKSFVSTNFSTLIDIEPVELDTCYDVELADGKVVSTNNVLIGCTLNLLNHSFPIDLMVIELGSFDVIIGMDWLSRYDAAILCGEKKVRIPLEGKTTPNDPSAEINENGGVTPQPSDPIENVADKAIHKELGDSLVRVATTASSLEAKQDSGSPWCQETMGILLLKLGLRVYLNIPMIHCSQEKTKTTQHNEIASLKRRVKKLEKKDRSRTHRLKRLYKVGLTARVESSDNEESLGEDESKQGRIDAIDADEEITLVSVHDVNVSAGEEVFTTTVDDITLAQVLEEIREERGCYTRVGFDEETILNLQAKFDEEERLAREKAEKEKEANIALIETWDDIQAKIDDHHCLKESSTRTRKDCLI